MCGFDTSEIVKDAQRWWFWFCKCKFNCAVVIERTGYIYKGSVSWGNTYHKYSNRLTQTGKGEFWLSMEAYDDICGHTTQLIKGIINSFNLEPLLR